MDVKCIVEKYKAPFYLYELKELRARTELVRDSLPGIAVCYAMKAAPVLAPYMAEYADRLEVCSPGEYEICIRNGVSPDRLLVSGVNKTYDSMKRILSLGGADGAFTIESEKHFDILEKCAAEEEIKLDCYVRLSSGNQFGVDEDTFKTICQKVIDSSNLNLVGIHFFSGTQKKLAKIESELHFLADFGKTLKAEFGQSLELEYGPGLGIDYFVDPKGGTADDVDETTLKALNGIIEDTGLKEIYGAVTFEHGRFLAATSGKYFTAVNDLKNTNGANYVILDGGIHQINYFGSMAGMKVPYIDVVKMGADSVAAEGDVQAYTLCGSLCSVNDVLVRSVQLPTLEIGDVLCFNKCGAYSATEGISLFLSRDIPAIVVELETGETQLVREHREINGLNDGTAK